MSSRGEKSSFLPFWLDKSVSLEGEKKKDGVNWCIVGSVDEEDSGAGQGGQGVSHLADSGVVDESSKKEQEAWRANTGTVRHS